MLQIEAGFQNNAVVWITSPADQDERNLAERTLIFLEPLLQSKKVRFIRFEPTSKMELSQFLEGLEQEARTGMRPIIHIDTHGDPTDGIYIAASNENLTWKELAELLRPINVAAKNNVCIVSAACFSMQTIMQLDFKQPTPFFVMFAPSNEVSFGFIDKRTFAFYEDVFTSFDVMSAYQRQLSPKLQQFHCQRLVLKSLSGYLRDSCTGRGRRKRIQALMIQNLGPGKKFPDTLEFRRLMRRIALATMKPTQELVDRHAKPFLMGATLPLSFDEILAFARADAMRLNVLKRRAARARGRARAIRYARRKCSRVPFEGKSQQTG